MVFRQCSDGLAKDGKRYIFTKGRPSSSSGKYALVSSGNSLASSEEVLDHSCNSTSDDPRRSIPANERMDHIDHNIIPVRRVYFSICNYFYIPKLTPRITMTSDAALLCTRNFWNYILFELMASLSVTALLIPQGMSYAKLAGLPVEYGLYAVTSAPIVYACFGSSPYLSIGPISLLSLAIPPVVSEVFGIVDNEENYVQIVLSISFLVGFFMILGSILKAGNLIKLIFSSTCLSAYICAAALSITLNEMKFILQITDKIPSCKYNYEIFYQIIKYCKFTSDSSLILGLTVIVVLGLFKYLSTNVTKYIIELEEKRIDNLQRIQILKDSVTQSSDEDPNQLSKYYNFNNHDPKEPLLQKSERFCNENRDWIKSTPITKSTLKEEKDSSTADDFSSFNSIRQESKQRNNSGLFHVCEDEYQYKNNEELNSPVTINEIYKKNQYIAGLTSKNVELKRQRKLYSTIQRFSHLGPLCVIILSSIYVYFNPTAHLDTVGIIDEGLPTPSINILKKEPDGSLNLLPRLPELVAHSLPLMLIGFCEGYAIASKFSFAMSESPSLNINQEMFALGIANLVGSFFNAMPTSGSLTRTTVGVEAGTKSTLTNIFVSIIIMMVLYANITAVQYIPMTALGGVIVFACFSLYDFSFVRRAFVMSFIDLAVVLSTFLVTLVYSTDVGIEISLALALLTLWYREEGLAGLCSFFVEPYIHKHERILKRIRLQSLEDGIDTHSDQSSKNNGDNSCLSGISSVTQIIFFDLRHLQPYKFIGNNTRVFLSIEKFLLTSHLSTTYNARSQYIEWVLENNTSPIPFTSEENGEFIHDIGSSVDPWKHVNEKSTKTDFMMVVDGRNMDSEDLKYDDSFEVLKDFIYYFYHRRIKQDHTQHCEVSMILIFNAKLNPEHIEMLSELDVIFVKKAQDTREDMIDIAIQYASSTSLRDTLGEF